MSLINDTHCPAVSDRIPSMMNTGQQESCQPWRKKKKHLLRLLTILSMFDEKQFG